MNKTEKIYLGSLMAVILKLRKLSLSNVVSQCSEHHNI